MIDLIIAGAGPVGMISAIFAHDYGIRFRWIAPSVMAPDSRLLALSPRSVSYLQRAGVWSSIHPSSLTAIDEVSIRHGGAQINLQARSFNLAALGYSVTLKALQEGLQNALEKRGIALQTGVTVEGWEPLGQDLDINMQTPEGMEKQSAHALLMAVGTLKNEAGKNHQPPASIPSCSRSSWWQDLPWQILLMSARQPMGAETIDYRYDVQAWMMNIAHPHWDPHRAWEHFSDHGVIALIPGENRVFKAIFMETHLPRTETENIQSLLIERLRTIFADDPRFSGELLQVVSPPQSFQPQLKVKKEGVEGRVVWVGNSAQTMSPVGGQGFNSGLHDVWSLFRAFADHGTGAVALKEFSRQRRRETPRTLLATHLMTNAHHLPKPMTEGLAKIVQQHEWLAHWAGRRLMFGMPI